MLARPRRPRPWGCWGRSRFGGRGHSARAAPVARRSRTSFDRCHKRMWRVLKKSRKNSVKFIHLEHKNHTAVTIFFKMVIMCSSWTPESRMAWSRTWSREFFEAAAAKNLSLLSNSSHLTTVRSQWSARSFYYNVYLYRHAPWFYQIIFPLCISKGEYL